MKSALAQEADLWCIKMKKAILAFSLLLTSFLGAEETLSIIKPDAIQGRHIGEIISRFEKNGLQIAAIKMVRLTPQQAEKFYSEHEGKPFFKGLTEFMASGPIVVMVLSGPDAISKNRELMGATDFQKAADGTLRKDFASSITKNAVHGSDSKESAGREIPFFFTSDEIVNLK
jgi:nucleoside-diphosphate kinase